MAKIKNTKNIKTMPELKTLLLLSQRNKTKRFASHVKSLETLNVKQSMRAGISTKSTFDSMTSVQIEKKEKVVKLIGLGYSIRIGEDQKTELHCLTADGKRCKIDLEWGIVGYFNDEVDRANGNLDKYFPLIRLEYTVKEKEDNDAEYEEVLTDIRIEQLINPNYLFTNGTEIGKIGGEIEDIDIKESENFPEDITETQSAN